MISPASLSEKVTVVFLQWIRSLRRHLPLFHRSVVFFPLRMISVRLAWQICERLWLELTTYEIKDDNAFVLFPPRFLSTAFFLWYWFGILNRIFQYRSILPNYFVWSMPTSVDMWSCSMTISQHNDDHFICSDINWSRYHCLCYGIDPFKYRVYNRYFSMIFEKQQVSP